MAVMRNPMPGVAHRGATRERILRAASDLFARQGFSHVSMRAVAEAAGVTKPALYYHFRDKEALFEECLSDFNEELAGTMAAAARCEGGMPARVRAVAGALLTGSPFHPIRIHEELAEHVSGGLRERLRASFRGLVVVPVTELFETLQSSGELRDGVSPPAAAAVLIGACIAFLGSAQQDEGWAPLPINGLHAGQHTAADLVADLVLHGLSDRRATA
jgi:TetR/AcrR family transcriptional regulator